MNIYEDEGSTGIVDLRAAAHELKLSAGVTNDATRRALVAEIQTAAMLDIAASLRILADESRFAMGATFRGELIGSDDEAESEELPRDFLVVGDLVAVSGYDDPAEVRGLGFSEGALWADVLFATGADARVWASGVTRLVGDEADDESMKAAVEETIAEIAALNAEADGEPDLSETREGIEALVDDIDDDFDGDRHPEAATALDVLKANEAARKAGKKKGGKK